MHKYRLTRPEKYPDPNSRGYSDPYARQGYYLYAENESAALREMAKEFPREYFTCEIWDGK
jgi:hypothetical protein